MAELICSQCGVPMVPTPTEFEYMGHTFNHLFPRCPQCRQVYIPKSDANGRMADVERELEDK